MSDLQETGRTPELKRVIGLPLLVLYGLGITIGAGIYVLIGVAAGEAGIFAPSAFLFAAFVMVFSALSFAEFSGRIPQSAGEAIYVDAGFGWPLLTLLTGLSIVFAAVIAGAAISLGCAGYVAELVDGGTTDIGLEASIAKLRASDLAMKMTTEAVQIYGGYGYIADYRVERLMRDAKVKQIWEGTNQVHRQLIGRSFGK